METRLKTKRERKLKTKLETKGERKVKIKLKTKEKMRVKTELKTKGARRVKRKLKTRDEEGFSHLCDSAGRPLDCWMGPGGESLGSSRLGARCYS